jgi:hypothetical protein
MIPKSGSSLKKAGIALLLAICCYMGISREANALPCDEKFNGPHCWCRIRAGCSGYIVHDFGNLCRYREIASGKQADCAGKCADEARKYGDDTVRSPASSLSICSNMGAGTWDVNAYSIVGAVDRKTNACDSDRSIGKITCTVTPQVCKCPAGWTCNGCSPQVDGGITTDGRCKKLACQPNQVTPYPPNGMPVGTPNPPYGTSSTSWGFSWGNAFYAWGNAANGGAPNCTGGGWGFSWH